MTTLGLTWTRDREVIVGPSPNLPEVSKIPTRKLENARILSFPEELPTLAQGEPRGMEVPKFREGIESDKTDLQEETIRPDYASDNGLSPVEEETESYVSSKEGSGSEDESISEENEDFAEEAFGDRNLRNKEELEENCEPEMYGPGATNDLEDIQRKCCPAVLGNRNLQNSMSSEMEACHQGNKFDGNPTEEIDAVEGFVEEEAENGTQEVEGCISDEETLNDSIRRDFAKETTAVDDEALDSLKSKLAKSERKIERLKNQLSLEKFRSREFTLQCHEKCMKANELLKEELQSDVAKKMEAQVARWQLEERKRVNEYISTVSEIYLEGIARGLKKDAREWHVEEAKRTYEMIRKEKVRQESESQMTKEELKSIYEKIQRYLENLDEKNKKSYASLRKQMDVWEDHLRDDIVKLHDEDLKKLRLQVNLLYEGQIDNRYGMKKQQRGEWQEEVQRTCKDYAMKRTKAISAEEKQEFESESFLKHLNEKNGNELRKAEQSLKRKVEGYRQDLAKKMDDKIAELWTAFEEFKHNFTLNNKYESGHKERDDTENDTDSASDSYGDFVNKGILKSDCEGNENVSCPPKPVRKRKSKQVSFKKNLLMEMPIVPQIKDENLKRK